MNRLKFISWLSLSVGLTLSFLVGSQPAAAQRRNPAPAATPAPSAQRPTLQQGIPVYESSAPTTPKVQPQTAPAPNQRRQLMPLDQLRASNFTVQTLDGKLLPIAELLNTSKPVVIEFWQMSCELSQAEIRFLNDIWERYERKGLTLIALTIDDPAQRQTVRSFIRSTHINYPVYFTSPSLYKFMMGGASGTPQTFVFDRAGRIGSRIIGWDAKRGYALEDAILSAY